MKVNCASGALPLVYPINVEFAYISWFCLQKGNGIIHLDKMGLVLRVFFKISLIASRTHECTCSAAAFWDGMRFVLWESCKSYWWKAMINKRMRVWGDDLEGESFCCTSVRTWVPIPMTQVKSWMSPCTDISLELCGIETESLGLAGCQFRFKLKDRPCLKKIWCKGVKTEQHGHAYTHTCVYAHTHACTMMLIFNYQLDKT